VGDSDKGSDKGQSAKETDAIKSVPVRRSTRTTDSSVFGSGPPRVTPRQDAATSIDDILDSGSGDSDSGGGSDSDKGE